MFSNDNRFESVVHNQNVDIQMIVFDKKICLPASTCSGIPKNASTVYKPRFLIHYIL